MQEKINVTIERENENVMLVFNFENVIKLNLSLDNQDELKDFFQTLLKKLFDDYNSLGKQYNLSFNDKEGKDLFHDVAEKYITNLDAEIQSIYSKMQRNI